MTPTPVNQNGSFEFDRVIKRGPVMKRTRKTKQWKPVYLVLRPNLLSVYRDHDETKLRHQITLSDITAVARQKDSKKKVQHVFGVFSPARNYHLAATTDKDAQQWVHMIRDEARIDEHEEDIVLMSPTGNKTFTGFDRGQTDRQTHNQTHMPPDSSSDVDDRPSSSIAPDNMHSTRRPSHALNYSTNDYGSLSDFSDAPGPIHAVFHASANSLSPAHQAQLLNQSQQSNIGAVHDDERVVYHGWLHVLKSKGGVRQWKKVWVVLRPKALGLYKNDQEYSAILIIPFSAILDAVDIDPPSKSKQYCLQVITEDKNFRFSAPDEDSLSKWLGAFKSLLVKRKDAGYQRVVHAPVLHAPTKPANAHQSVPKALSLPTKLPQTPPQQQPSVLA